MAEGFLSGGSRLGSLWIEIEIVKLRGGNTAAAALLTIRHGGPNGSVIHRGMIDDFRDSEFVSLQRHVSQAREQVIKLNAPQDPERIAE